MADRAEIVEMLEEWRAAGEAIAPMALTRAHWADFPDYLAHLDVPEARDGLVPDSTFFCRDMESGRMVGAVNIRHALTDGLLRDGGHIGDGVRPSARRRGVATAMIGLALAECRRHGLRRVLMTCDRANVASAKSIVRNGGVLEDEPVVNGRQIQRYWIELT